MTQANLNILIQAGEGLAALRQVDVAEILPLVRMDRPAGAPRALAGFMNLGGAPTPVLRLAVLMGGEPAEDDDIYSHIVRLKPIDGRPSIGLLADRVLDAAAAAEASVAVPPDESLNGVVAETLTINGRFVPRLDAAKLLLAEEEARLAEMTRAMAERLAEWSAA